MPWAAPVIKITLTSKRFQSRQPFVGFLVLQKDGSEGKFFSMRSCVTRAHEQIKGKYLLKPNLPIIKIMGSNTSLCKCTYLHCSFPQCVLFSFLCTCTLVHLLNHVFRQKEHATDIEGETQVPIFSIGDIHTTVVNPSVYKRTKMRNDEI